MNPDRLTGKLSNYFKKLKMSNTWFKGTEKHIEELQITQEDIEERLPLKKKLKNAQGFQKNPKKWTGDVWTDERRERHRSRMKEVWERKKRDEKLSLIHI